MSLLLLRGIALILVPIITASARPAATFLGTLIAVSWLDQAALLSLPPSLQWFLSAPIFAVALTLALLEALATQQTEVATLINALQVDRIAAAISSGTVALIMASLGLPESEAAALLTSDMLDLSDADTAGEALAATLLYVELPGGTLAAFGIAAAAAYALATLRSYLVEVLQELLLYRFVAILETGGVLAVLILLPFAPILALLLVFAFALTMAALVVIARRINAARDARTRVPCPHCEAPIRPEASLCPRCRKDIS